MEKIGKIEKEDLISVLEDFEKRLCVLFDDVQGLIDDITSVRVLAG